VTHHGSGKCCRLVIIAIEFFINLVYALLADPSGRAVYGVVLRPLACWDFGFESRRGHGCLSVYFLLLIFY